MQGVDLYLHQQGLDTSTPSGRAMYKMMGVFAEFERAIIRERVMSGLARAKAEGITLGRPALEDANAAKVKATTQGYRGGYIRYRYTFDLEVAEYDILRSTTIQSAKLLIVLALSEDAEEWLRGDEESLILRRCAYWQNLYGRSPVDNKSTIRIHISRTQMFHAQALRELMRRAHEKAILGETGI
jgi:hypothetical protein